ncbi:MAG: FAD binding domain-containing protein [Fusicatenibacter sp.]
MLSFNQYVRAQSLEEAYELCQKRSNVVLGGMLWLKMQNGSRGTAIDLCDLGLDQIEETPEEYRIGAMVSLRTLEMHDGLNTLTQGSMAEAVKHIVGVQFRNVATIGGSIYGRFGFSDVLTLFMALDAKVELYHAGVMSVKEFADFPRKTRDILVRVIVPKTARKTVYLTMRNTETDFPVLTCALSCLNGQYTCVVGARPMKAAVYEDEKQILSEGITPESVMAFAEDIASRAEFGSNLRGGADYREKICGVLVRRAVLALGEVS